VISNVLCCWTELNGFVLLMYLAARHVCHKHEMSCAETNCNGDVGDAVLRHGCTVSCDSVVVKQQCVNEMNTAGRLFSLPDSVAVPTCRSPVSVCASFNQTSVTNSVESVITSEKCHDSQNSYSAISNLSARPPCDRLYDIYLSDSSKANSFSSTVSMLAAESTTKPLLDTDSSVGVSSQLFSCVKESIVARDTHSCQADVVSPLSSVIGVQNHLPEIDGSCLEVGRSVTEVNLSSAGLLAKSSSPQYVQASFATSVCCLPDCATVAMNTSQNGLSTVGHIVSCLKSMTGVAKSQKSAPSKGTMCMLF